MKILVLGDIHGRPCWKPIIEKENPDLTIFLGDYVSTHENITPAQQITNLEAILQYKEANMDKVILLRGNHDIQHLGYYWASCSGYSPHVAKYMIKNLDRFLKLSQWIYIYDQKVFSHAGISQEWMDNVAKLKSIEEINKHEPSEIFGFWPCKFSDYTGISATQPPTRIRPQTLSECSINGYTQIVGHTPVNNIEWVGRDDGGTIWLCDNLPSQYLIIENGEFGVRDYEEK